jgi:hypothetical protein
MITGVGASSGTPLSSLILPPLPATQQTTGPRATGSALEVDAGNAASQSGAVQPAVAPRPAESASLVDANGMTPFDRDQAHISGPAKLLSQLQQLQSQDPSRFRELALEVSHLLGEAAQQVTGSQSLLLSSLSEKFRTAANIGSLAGLV